MRIRFENVSVGAFWAELRTDRRIGAQMCALRWWRLTFQVRGSSAAGEESIGSSQDDPETAINGTLYEYEVL